MSHLEALTPIIKSLQSRVNRFFCLFAFWGGGVLEGNENL